MPCEGETHVTKPRLVRARRGEERRGEPVGRAFCASGRSFSISPPPPPFPPPPCSPSPSIFLARSTFRCSSVPLPSFSHSFAHSIAFLRPSAFSLPCSFRLSSPACHPSLPPLPSPTNPLRLSVIISELASG